MRQAINKRNIITAIKTAIGCIVAIAIAMIMELEYAPSAGIITILSIQPTKRATYQVAIKRLFAFLCALCIAFVTFNLLGFTLAGFSAYVILYIFLCVIFEWHSAMAVNSVLVTHFWAAESMNMDWIINEGLLFIVGVGIGIIINATLHSNRVMLENVKDIIEDDISQILARMSKEIFEEDKSKYKGKCFGKLEKDIDNALNVAYESINNSLDNALKKHLEYILMRKNQAIVLKKIYQNMLLLSHVPSQGYVIAEFIEYISAHIKEENDVTVNINRLKEIFELMKKEPLPESRKEFENRAILFHILYQFEEFLRYKEEFQGR